jgi:hypothetical protein
VRQLEACLNSGDQLRLYALYSDETFRRIPRTDEILEELATLKTATPLPVPAEQRQILIGPWYMRLLDDGRVLAAVQFSIADETLQPGSTKALLFVRQGDPWLIDEVLSVMWVAGNDSPVEVIDIVGTPPSS